jgi:hypothetical protein
MRPYYYFLIVQPSVAQLESNTHQVGLYAIFFWDYPKGFPLQTPL